MTCMLQISDNQENLDTLLFNIEPDCYHGLILGGNTLTRPAMASE
jgi:hypothetical protein